MRGFLKFLKAPQLFLVLELSWLPAGKITYEAFSVNPSRIPVYQNNNTIKSFLVETFWRYPGKNWGVDFGALQAGRTVAQEYVGSYQTSPLSISVTSWQLMLEREAWAKGDNFLAGLVGVGTVTDQWERTRNIVANGVAVDEELGLDPQGTSRTGIRASVENLALPIGARGRFWLFSNFFNETILTYSFLIDFTDVLQGSSPFSGWATQAKTVIGWNGGGAVELFAGVFGYVNHMAAPTGTGGLRLRAGSQVPEGVYVLWQENEIHMLTGLVGIGYRF